MKLFIKLVVLVTLVLVAPLSYAQQYSKVTYVHSDADGSPFAATDQQGNIEWEINRYPYGYEYDNSGVARKSEVSFAGKPYDEEIGLSYFGARWYDPDTGRFASIDPVPASPDNFRTFNRYSYGFNNPYKYRDPDGRYAEVVFEAGSLAVGFSSLASNIASGNYSSATIDAGGLVIDGLGVLIPGVPGVAGLGIAASRQGAKTANTIPDSTLVCRGGLCTAKSFEDGSKVTKDADGILEGISTQSRPGATIDELAQPLQNGQIGVTTVGDIKALGGQVILDGNAKNPNHATVGGITAEQAEKLFTPTIPNPVPKAKRGK